MNGGVAIKLQHLFNAAFDISMRDLVALVNNPDVTGGVDVHMEACYACKEGGDLLCCDGCTAVYHLGCAQLEVVPEVGASLSPILQKQNCFVSWSFCWSCEGAQLLACLLHV